jgi:hypothetical protein
MSFIQRIHQPRYGHLRTAKFAGVIQVEDSRFHLKTAFAPKDEASGSACPCIPR